MLTYHNSKDVLFHTFKMRNIKSFPKILVKFLICREYNKIYDQLRTVDLEKITELTNCSKPCHYNKYSFIWTGSSLLWNRTSSYSLSGQCLTTPRSQRSNGDLPDRRVWRRPWPLPRHLLHVTLGQLSPLWVVVQSCVQLILYSRCVTFSSASLGELSPLWVDVQTTNLCLIIRLQ